MEKLSTNNVSLKILLTGLIEWLAYSNYLKRVYVGTDQGVIRIKETDLTMIESISANRHVVLGQDVPFRKIYGHQVDDFSLAHAGERAAWIDDGKLIIFNLDQETTERIISLPRGEEEFLEVHIDPSGKLVLALVEIDKEEEAFCLYQWRILEINKEEWKDFGAVPVVDPDEFLLWDPGTNGAIMNRGSEGNLYQLKTENGGQRSLNLGEWPGEFIESSSFNIENKTPTFCIQNEEEQGEVFIYSRNDGIFNKMTHFQMLKIKPEGIAWSPSGNWFLFKDVSLEEPVVTMLSRGGERLHKILPISGDGQEDFSPQWLWDDRHIAWFSDNYLCVTRLTHT